MIDGSRYALSSTAVPVWLISRDARLRTDIAGSLTKAGRFCLMGTFGRWQSAVPVLRGCGSRPPQIVLVDEDPGTPEGARCLSYLKNAGSPFQVIVLMSSTCDRNLVSALSNGVSGFVVKPTTADELVTAMDTVIRGEVWMKRFVLDRIASLVPHVMLTKSLSLTNREQEIVGLAINGYSTKAIADRLNISYYTVDTHIKNIYQKLKVNNRSGLVSLILHNGVS